MTMARRPMKVRAGSFLIAAAVLACAIEAAACWAFWLSLAPDERSVIAALWASRAGIAILLAVLLLLLLGLILSWILRLYIRPLHTLAEESRIMAVSHPGHRLRQSGTPEVQELIASINLLAERHQALQEDVETRIRAASITLEEEKSTLAALVSKLSQGVLVCNNHGQILLYNQRAKRLLEQDAVPSEASGWIGLGRSLYAILDQSLITQALAHIRQRIEQGESSELVTSFVAMRPRGQFLSVQLVPVLDREKAMSGYILTLEDITRHTEKEHRLGKLLQCLIEEQSAAVAGIRAAIETMLDYPNMEKQRQHQFKTAIREEALKLSQILAHATAAYSDYLQAEARLEEMLGSELLTTLEHRFSTTFGIKVKVSAPAEPLWLRVDRYAMVQAMMFAMAQLLEGYHAEHVELKLERQPSFAGLAIVWEGADLDAQTLRKWSQQTLLSNQDGHPLSLRDVVERHGGAVWWQSEATPGHHALRVLLPVLVDKNPENAPPVLHPHDAAANANETSSDEEGWRDYDFHLFHRPEQHSALDDTPLTALAYTVIDTETTGLNPTLGDEIIALGAVRIINQRILRNEVFQCLVNPQRPISQAALAIHGISASQLRDKPALEEVLSHLYRFVEDSVIIGHNVAFDMRFFELKEARTGIRFRNPVLDTLLLARVVHPHQAEHSLEAIAARLGVLLAGRHTAVGDTLTTAQIFLALIPLLADRNIRTLGQAVDACARIPSAHLRY